ncbi:innexin unc-9-like isoform X2 [Littorina saxatilis]|uniref:innexin unc-9-like isoform X2 n=1 Tax=Littorina saxatilis TaxID=31220 RepID=UPI0038B6777C
MSINAIVAGFATYSKLQSSHDDDRIDRLNHLYTVTILVVFAIFVGGGQYVGTPIECTHSTQPDAALRTYAKTYCWVANTYYVPMKNELPSNIIRRESLELSYYQWVPIILLFMALLFKLPSICWRLLSGASGIDLDKIVSLTLESQMGDHTRHRETVQQIADYMDRWLDAHRQYHWNVMVRIRQKISKLCCFCFGKRHGCYLSGLYLVVKLGYSINVISQFFILNRIMGGWWNIFGMEILTGLTNTRERRESPYFPKVTLCDFEIRQLNNLQRWTFQCVLPINLFNEQIFSFLWFWFIFVACMTIFSFGLWVARAIVRNSRSRYVRKFLKAQGELTGEEDKRLADRFADHYLRDDGIFVLRVVAKNSNNVVISDLLLQLWRLYKSKPLVRTGADEVLV